MNLTETEKRLLDQLKSYDQEHRDRLIKSLKVTIINWIVPRLGNDFNNDLKEAVAYRMENSKAMIAGLKSKLASLA